MILLGAVMMALMAAPLRAQVAAAPAEELASVAASEGQSEEQSQESQEQSEEEEHDGMDWMLIPLIAGTSDLGFGGAIFAQLLWFDEETAPFRDRLFVVASLTHFLIQNYGVQYEHIGFGGRPLRLGLSTFFAANPNLHYCGLGNAASCSSAQADAFLLGLGLEDAERDEVFKYRAMTLRFGATLRVPALGSIEGLELDLRWRGEILRSGFFSEDGPYAASLYAQDFPAGEEGFVSEFQVGLLYDRRNNETAPSRGSLTALHLRGAHSATGSTWDYFGVTLAATGYLPLDSRERWVWANRFTADLIVGDAPIQELGRVGGFWPGPAYGGMTYGRGIRQSALAGRIKLIAQTELRGTFYRFESKGISVGGQVFVDAGWLGADWDHFGGDAAHIDIGFGGGLSVRWGRAFALRVDIGLSPFEDFAPQFGLSLSEPF